METTELIKHPEQLDRDTLYDLRSMLALYPYYQPARLLMLQNLYLLHDSAFDEEMRRAAIYATDRKAIFNMVETAHYQFRQAGEETLPQTENDGKNRTVALIDSFLDSIPKDEEDTQKKRRPTPADAAVDYVAYLLESENSEDGEKTAEPPQMKGQDLIDTFLEQEQGRILLNDLSLMNSADSQDSEPEQHEEKDENDEEFFTETLARIYIKQGRYQKALDIISRLSTKYPPKNAYFADQMRFLEKLIINNNKNKK